MVAFGGGQVSGAGGANVQTCPQATPLPASSVHPTLQRPLPMNLTRWLVAGLTWRRDGERRRDNLPPGTDRPPARHGTARHGVRGSTACESTKPRRVAGMSPPARPAARRVGGRRRSASDHRGRRSSSALPACQAGDQTSPLGHLPLR